MLLATRRVIATSRLLSTRAGVGHSGHLSADNLKNQHDAPDTTTAGLSAKQRYLFDLNGFLVVKGALSPDEVKAANDAIDANADKLHERKGQLRTSALYGRESSALAGDGETGRIDGGGMLGWEAPHRESSRRRKGEHLAVAKGSI